MPFDVVDDIDGTLHQAVSPKLNSAYTLTADGTIAARIQWAIDKPTVRAAFDALVNPTAKAPRRGRVVGPHMTAVGHLSDVVARAGSTSGSDAWKAAAPLALLGAIASRLTPLLTDRRDPAAALLLGSLALIAATTAILVLRRPQPWGGIATPGA